MRNTLPVCLRPLQMLLSSLTLVVGSTDLMFLAHLEVIMYCLAWLNEYVSGIVIMKDCKNNDKI